MSPHARFSPFSLPHTTDDSRQWKVAPSMPNNAPPSVKYDLAPVRPTAVAVVADATTNPSAPADPNELSNDVLPVSEDVGDVLSDREDAYEDVHAIGADDLPHPGRLYRKPSVAPGYGFSAAGVNTGSAHLADRMSAPGFVDASDPVPTSDGAGGGAGVGVRVGSAMRGRRRSFGGRSVSDAGGGGASVPATVSAASASTSPSTSTSSTPSRESGSVQGSNDSTAAAADGAAAGDGVAETSASAAGVSSAAVGARTDPSPRSRGKRSRAKGPGMRGRRLTLASAASVVLAHAQWEATKEAIITELGQEQAVPGGVAAGEEARTLEPTASWRLRSLESVFGDAGPPAGAYLSARFGLFSSALPCVWCRHDVFCNTMRVQRCMFAHLTSSVWP